SLNQKRGTTTPILRILGIATPPIAIDARHAGRRTAAQNRETLAMSGGYHALALSDGRGILENSLNTLSLVIRATSSLLTPIVSANMAAVCCTKDGSLRLPRCGSGARNGASVSTNRRSRGTMPAI